MDGLGNLYGVTGGGGKCGSGCDEGTVFELSPPATAGGAWTEDVLYRFGSSGPDDGGTPIGGLSFGAHGSLFGTTFYGRSTGSGTVFALLPPSSPGGQWAEQVLYNFTGGTSDGLKPMASLTADGHHGFYGTTSDTFFQVFTTCGGTYCGHVFDISPPAAAGEPWTFTTIWSFSGPDGSTPYNSVTVDKSGNLYGTTAYGGSAGAGAIFKLTPPAAAGGSWAETTLYDFSFASGGSEPSGNLIFGKGGKLYGTTWDGGDPGCDSGCGTIFAVEP
jgi:uncharacterized repeat protein (TIGR03803 family)